MAYKAAGQRPAIRFGVPSSALLVHFIFGLQLGGRLDAIGWARAAEAYLGINDRPCLIGDDPRVTVATRRRMSSRRITVRAGPCPDAMKGRGLRSSCVPGGCWGCTHVDDEGGPSCQSTQGNSLWVSICIGAAV